MFIGNDTVSEIVNYSDSDGSNFSECSDIDMCKVHLPFSSSSSSSSSSSNEEKVLHPKPDIGRKRTCRAPPKRADTDFQLGWEKKCRWFRYWYIHQ
jgi:hypothetical protein